MWCLSRDGPILINFTLLRRTRSKLSRTETHRCKHIRGHVTTQDVGLLPFALWLRVPNKAWHLSKCGFANWKHDLRKVSRGSILTKALRDTSNESYSHLNFDVDSEIYLTLIMRNSWTQILISGNTKSTSWRQHFDMLEVTRKSWTCCKG